MCATRFSTSKARIIFRGTSASETRSQKDKTHDATASLNQQITSFSRRSTVSSRLCPTEPPGCASSATYARVEKTRFAEDRKLEAKTRRWFRSCGPRHISLIVSTIWRSKRRRVASLLKCAESHSSGWAREKRSRRRETRSKLTALCGCTATKSCSTSALSPEHISWRTRRRTIASPWRPITSSMFIDPLESSSSWSTVSSSNTAGLSCPRRSMAVARCRARRMLRW
mmetsp:Transcript_5120/g.11334  ORF Transcript_5120/g.11334 Transcript_5120/m.11334 type:complete len:227 (+) Transcript_5120:287-967(+)